MVVKRAVQTVLSLVVQKDALKAERLVGTSVASMVVSLAEK